MKNFENQNLKESASQKSAEFLELEKLRIKVRFLSRMLKLLIGISVAGGIALLASGLGIVAAVFAVTGLIITLVVWINMIKAKNQYEASFKEQVVKNELMSFLNDVEFEPERSLGERIVKDSGLFFSYDVYSGNDYLSASYKDRSFVQSDIHLQEEHEEEYRDGDDENGELKTRTTYTTLFRGRLMIFDYDAISDEPVYVYDRRMRRLSESGIKSELDSFNRKFVIKASGAIAAFRILTPPVLEGISLASDKLKCPISLSFLNDKIYIAIENGDSFEVTTKGNATVSQQQERVRGEIQTVLDMVETIYLKK